MQGCLVPWKTWKIRGKKYISPGKSGREIRTDLLRGLPPRTNEERLFFKGFPRTATRKLVQLFRRESHFRAVQSNYEATDKVFILFCYPSMNFSRKNYKIQTKVFWLKIEKKLGVPLAFFSNFSPKNFILIFWFLQLKIIEGN